MCVYIYSWCFNFTYLPSKICKLSIRNLTKSSRIYESVSCLLGKFKNIQPKCKMILIKECAINIYLFLETMLILCLCVCGKYSLKEVDWFENISTNFSQLVGHGPLILGHRKIFDGPRKPIFRLSPVNYIQHRPSVSRIGMADRLCPGSAAARVRTWKYSPPVFQFFMPRPNALHS